MRICDGKCAKTVSNLFLVIGEIVVGSLDEEKFNSTVDACVDVCSLNATINSRTNGSRL